HHDALPGLGDQFRVAHRRFVRCAGLGARAAAGAGADGPIAPVVNTAVGIAQHERVPPAVRHRGPRCPVLILDRGNGEAVFIQQPEAVALLVEPADPRPEDAHIGGDLVGVARGFCVGHGDDHALEG
ncbi:MAG: hypothetical protein ACK55I_28490, partial [bacterium]